REKGSAPLAARTMGRWFTGGYGDRDAGTTKAMTEMFIATPQAGYIACGEAVRDMDHRALLPQIKVPTLVVAGRHDPATTLQAGEYLRDHIPGASFAVLEAAPISNIEAAAQVNQTVLAFL